jgi:putative transposase
MSRRFAKGKAPSNGYKRARREAAKVHAKGVRQNVHDTRVWAKAVVEHHQLIAVEDFKPMLLAKSTMAAKSADAAVGAAKHELVERGLRAGRTVVLVPPAYTTMTCSNCAWRNNTRLGLGMRTFRCEACGFEAGRDWNAARVIPATGERIRADVDDVRHLLPPLEDVVVRSESEIPRLQPWGTVNCVSCRSERVSRLGWSPLCAGKALPSSSDVSMPPIVLQLPTCERRC